MYPHASNGHHYLRINMATVRCQDYNTCNSYKLVIFTNREFMERYGNEYFRQLQHISKGALKTYFSIIIWFCYLYTAPYNQSLGGVVATTQGEVRVIKSSNTYTTINVSCQVHHSSFLVRLRVSQFSFNLSSINAQRKGTIFLINRQVTVLLTTTVEESGTIDI